MATNGGNDDAGSDAMRNSPLESPTNEDDWAFLRSWIYLLDDRFATHVNSIYTHESDPVRIGLDPNNDFWLEINLDRDAALRTHEDGEQAAMIQLREAIVLVHLLAIANYELWYKWMVTSGNYTPPTWFIPGDTNKIQMRYAIKFDHQHDPAFMSWEYSLVFLLSDVGCSDEFLADLEVATHLLARHGIAWSNIEPIPIKLIGDGDNVSQASAQLERLANVVMEMEKIEPESAVFRIVELDLELNRVEMTPHLFQALDQILRLGVSVDTLWLPQLPTDEENTFEENGDRVAELDRVADFMRTLMGLTADTGRPLTKVRRIVMPFRFARTRWFAPFCSALATSRFVRELQLYPCGNKAIDITGFGSDVLHRTHIWSWLAFALFSNASSTSLEALTLRGEYVLPSDVAAIVRIIQSADPLLLLFQKTVPTTNNHVRDPIPRQDRQSKSFMLHEYHSGRDGFHSYGLVGLRRQIVTGELMFAPSAGEDEVQAYIPGLGFCGVRSEIRPSKRLRLNSTPKLMSETNGSSSFKTLTIAVGKSCPLSITPLVHLIRLVGSRLRGLSVDSRGIDDPILREILMACPRLENLALRGAKLQSMEVLRRAYEQNGLPLSSLELSAISVHEMAFQRFLRSLLQCNKTEATLTRLRFGARWAHELSDSTLAILDNILTHNKTLTHVEYFISTEQSRRMGDTMQRYHGQVVEGISYTERRRRMAFLGGLRRRTLSNQRLEMDRHVKELVLQFAAPSPLRRCVTEDTTEIGGP